ncbi:hypothetical protein JZ751_021269 [Albula glossodonta]|uniref:Uncharacterized protein n=1 Tax=Albula glossodonta TaxID=121402 RepID=A0A8T2NJY7_9TELE|nr:hypothetical protein JZ751_021269 [Albula glossodonta]
MEATLTTPWLLAPRGGNRHMTSQPPRRYPSETPISHHTPLSRCSPTEGFNSNINLSGTTSPSSQFQDKNANNHASHHPHCPLPMENGNQLPNGLLEDEGHSRSNGSATSSLHRHVDSHHSQVTTRSSA